ncbi:MAG: hypothetical protein KAT65_08925, partial [Methanophagales archaeon]|nr:hypothetical protein [Methanophagales archaeon]
IYIVWCRYRTKQPEFWRYDPIEDKWNYSMNTSDLSTGAFRNGAALAWDGYDGCIYAMMGSRSHKNGTRFARYNCSSNLWENLTMPESWKNKTDDGASLVWTGREYLYALQGEIGERKPHKPITNFSRIIFLPLAGEAE